MWILLVKIIAIVCGNCIEQLVMPIKCEKCAKHMGNYMQQMHVINAYDNSNVKLYIKNGNDVIWHYMC
jgi:hypothetical protein